MSNLSNDSIPFQCQEPDTPVLDLFLYALTFSYFTIGLFLHGSILRMIFYTERKVYKDNSFFQIYAMDSMMSILLILGDIFFNRLFLYVYPLCPIFGPFFYEPSIILKIVYFILHYTRFSKSVVQIIMVLNRMSCVLAPANYDKIWEKFTPISRIVVAILPFGGVWNLIISRVFAQSIQGGFAINYKRAVQWAALSLFQSIYISTALFFTVTCTSITIYKLYFLPDRIKSAERALCITSCFISSTFLLVAATQLLILFCASCNRDLLFILQAFAFDTFTVGSAVILIASNKNLRTTLFSSGKKKQTQRVIVTVTPSSNIGKMLFLNRAPGSHLFKRYAEVEI